MLFWLRPSIVRLDENTCVMKIPLNRRSKNHLNCMYFGALAAGADIASGFLAFKIIHDSKEKISFLFKDFKADFKKRAEADTYFICNDGAAVRAMIDEARLTKMRVNRSVKVIATVPSKMGDEPVAEFELTMSVKLKT